MRAYRFAGLHRFGDSANGAVPVLEFDFTEPLTLILGKNGSGKTLLLERYYLVPDGSCFPARWINLRLDQDLVEVSIDSNDERLEDIGHAILPPKTVLESPGHKRSHTRGRTG